ncbi:MAG: 1-(5-phosphoribosyl)-5-[(5-phosphoribosylamino)methylideneamino]imidazole-4-carboxamide isomerase [Methanomicrobiales archaeon]|nr:1-(5-phosphoribosyl)-5-[(5-phosphoribosylamino)methylideneamino]imidazole-4-carboxamide isomerase [Methanomicrobiales archaeon]
MKIFPAVDILGGRCVQLVQGKRENATWYGDPSGCARRWIEEGADALHIINLDGAFGSAEKNVALIRSLVRETGVMIQLGGGIRTQADAAAWLETGVDRVILSTAGIRNPSLVRDLVEEFGSHRIMTGVDARGGEVLIEGWRQPAGDYLTWAQRFEKEGAGTLLYTNVEIEGLQAGIQPEPIQRLLDTVHIPVVVAGGISSRNDLRTLKGMGVEGAVLGSALYSGKITLQEAWEEMR